MGLMTSVPGDSESVPTSDSEQAILFVDDHQHFLTPVAALLNKSGFRVITATNGKDALQRAREFDGVIHVLVADVQMPGMGGIELAIQLRRKRPDTKILLIAAYDWGLLAQKYGWPFLQKPFHFDALSGGIRKLLAEQPSLKATDPTDLAGGFIGQHAGDE
jgi:two-component system cell cycle sensor histidine kinase/response regulator CckA